MLSQEHGIVSTQLYLYYYHRDIVRFVRSINKALGQDAPLMIKCMKLTAADQMEWAKREGKEEQVDIKVFVNLASKGITAWNIVLGKQTVTVQGKSFQHPSTYYK
jgi:hypothetical protein